MVNKPLRPPHQEPPTKLERSSLEAYAAMSLGILQGVLHMTVLIRASLFFVLCVLAADIAWRSPSTYRWPKTAKTILLVAAIGLIGWGGWKNVNEQYIEEEFPPGTRYMERWGLADQRPLTSEVIVKGYLLKRFVGKNKLIAVCFHANGLQEPNDTESSLSKSEPFDINDGLIHILIKWNEQFAHEAAVGRNSNYALLLAPEAMTPEDFRTINEALTKGAHLLDSNSGPP